MEPSSEQERVRGDEASRESIVPPRKRAACRPAPVHHSRARAVCIAGPVLVSAQNAYLLALLRPCPSPGSPGRSGAAVRVACTVTESETRRHVIVNRKCHTKSIQNLLIIVMVSKY